MKLGWRILIVLAAAGTGLYFSRRPWEVYREQKAKANTAVAQMDKAEQERVRMMEEKARAGSALGREEAIRERNWTKPGEKPVLEQP